MHKQNVAVGGEKVCCGKHEECDTTSREKLIKEHCAVRRYGSYGGRITIVTKPMTQEQARMLFPYRPIVSNRAESCFGGNTLADDTRLLCDGDATRCAMCTAPTRNVYLINDVCPDCDGRTKRIWGQDPTKEV